MKRVVLAFSGTADESIALRWLTSASRTEVVTLTLDLGLGREPAEIREHALALGAVRAHVVDVREPFARECVVPALGTSTFEAPESSSPGVLARPLVARHLVEICGLEGATSVAHGLTGADREQMDALIRAIDPSIAILTPPGNLPSGDEAPAAHAAAPQLEAPDTPATVDLAFENGVPVEISGVPMSASELIQCLDTIAGGHGIGGTGRQGVPALIVLDAAHRALQQAAEPGEGVSGLVRIELFKGDCRVLDRHAMA